MRKANTHDSSPWDSLLPTLPRGDQSCGHSVHRQSLPIRSARRPLELDPAGDDEHLDGSCPRGDRRLRRQRGGDGLPAWRAMPDGAHGRCLGCRVCGAVPRLREAKYITAPNWWSMA